MAGELFQGGFVYQPFVAELDCRQLSLPDQPPDRLRMDVQPLTDLVNASVIV